MISKRVYETSKGYITNIIGTELYDEPYQLWSKWPDGISEFEGEASTLDQAIEEVNNFNH